MDQTRSELSEKLETLENRVSESMQSTGAAVSDTMTSVRGAMQSVSESLDFRLQVHRHPWISFGGAVALGYLAARLSARPAQSPAMSVATIGPPPAPSRPAPEGDRSSSLSHNYWGELRGITLGLLVGGVRDLAARGLPLVLDYLGRQRREAVPSQAMVASTEETLPLPSTTTIAANRSLTRKVV